MTDRETVIKYLEEHLTCSGRGKAGYCPFSDTELWDLVRDAVELLKEQETEICDRCGRMRLKSSRITD